MSISIILVPLAVSAVSAATAAMSRPAATGQVVCTVETRMRDERLLVQALRATGASVSADQTTLYAAWQGVNGALTRSAEGIWSVHLSGEPDEEHAVDRVIEIDRAYGRELQAAVVQRLRDRAPHRGLRLESEQLTEDDSVTMVFAVENAGAGNGVMSG